MPRERPLMRLPLVAAAALVVCATALGAVIHAGSGDGSAHPAAPRGTPAAAAAPPPAPAHPQLPGGGRSILPEHRVLAHYGAPQAEALGILGIGTPAQAGARLRRAVRPYAGRGRKPVMPAMELIAVITTAAPGADGRYRVRQDPATIRRYLRAARMAGALLILDIQPGRSDFVTEVRALAPFLVEPDVGLALDPEWRMGPSEVPGRVIGQVDADEVNRVAAWMSKLVRSHDLPDKLLLIHQFEDGMIERRGRLRTHRGIDEVLNADGFGTAEAKTGTYRRVTRARAGFGTGFKLFYEEDTGLMSPGRVLRLHPRPDVVIYE